MAYSATVSIRNQSGRLVITIVETDAGPADTATFGNDTTQLIFRSGNCVRQTCVVSAFNGGATSVTPTLSWRDPTDPDYLTSVIVEGEPDVATPSLLDVAGTAPYVDTDDPSNWVELFHQLRPDAGTVDAITVYTIDAQGQ